MLTDKNIIIFGASGLIGTEIVKDILLSGANVIAVDKDFIRLKSKLNNIKDKSKFQKITYIKSNVLIYRNLEKIIMKSKNLNGVVNCLYLKNKSWGKSLENISIKDFNENITINLSTTFLINKLCIKKFKKTKKPISLLNFSSIYGVIPPKFEIYKNTSITSPIEYAIIKSATIHLTKYVANYVNNSDFRCNSISPGGIEDNHSKLFMKQYKRHTHGSGMLKPDSLSNLVIFLLSNKSKYINGQNIIIDDGFTL